MSTDKSIVKDEKTGRNTVVDSSLDYSVLAASHNTYRFNKIQPKNGYPPTLPTNLITGNGTQSTQFTIPISVANFSRDLITWTRGAIPAEVGRYLHVFEDVHGEVNAIKLFTDAGQYIVNTQFLQNYIEVIQRKELPNEEVQQSGDFESIYNPNEPLTINRRADSTTASLNYVEPRQVYHHPVMNDPIPAKRKVLRLGRLLNTFFALNKNIIFPEVLTLEIEWSPQKIGYTTSTHPSVAPIPLDPANFAVGAGISISNIQLYHCVETDPGLILQASEQLKKGMQIPVPVYTADRLQIPAGNQWTKDVTLNPNTHGASIQKIITCIFDNAEFGSNLAYARNNVDGERVTQYITMMNDNPIQQSAINCRTDKGEGYFAHKKQLEKSCTFNQNMFEYFNFHCDDWSNNTENKDKLVMSGIKNTSQKYSFRCDQAGAVGAAQNQHVYSFIIGQKFMFLKEGQQFAGLTVN